MKLNSHLCLVFITIVLKIGQLLRRTPKHFGHFLENIFSQNWTSDWSGFMKCPNLAPLVLIYLPHADSDGGFCIVVQNLDISKILSNPKSSANQNCRTKMTNMFWRPKMSKYLSLYITLINYSLHAMFSVRQCTERDAHCSIIR